MSESRDRLNRRLFAVGARLAPQLSIRTVRRVGALAALPVAAANGIHLRTYRENLTRVLGHPPDEATVRAGVASWLRTWFEVLALPAWSTDDILDRVATTGERHLRAAHAGPGAVVALPHLGNWDLAGAWACVSGLPVTAVAEDLGDQEFAAFSTLRSRLGMEVVRHGDPAAMHDLIAAVRRGRVVSLLSDRDLTGSGVPVRFAGHPVTMPAGPALIAQRSGAVLLAAAARYTADGMVLDISAPIPTRPGPDGLIAMTQDIADYCTTAIRRAPEDWHVFQPLFDRPTPSESRAGAP